MVDAAGRRVLRVGAVSYLNTRPLVFGLESHRAWMEVVYDLPSRLAEQLAAGWLDVGLIPSIDYLQQPDYRIVSDACIACRGPVLSVKLLARRPLSKVRTLALDEGSHTSAVLARILLRERYGLDPRCERLPIGASPDDASSDAVLLIGDRAIGTAARGFVEEWDLGDAWCRWSELPFVFAMWVARPGVDTEALERVLSTARDAGLAHLDQIAEREHATVGLDQATCLGYLRDNLYFRLGPRERQGLSLFAERARRYGWLPRVVSEVSSREIVP